MMSPPVAPAQAGAFFCIPPSPETPAFAGVTDEGEAPELG